MNERYYNTIVYVPKLLNDSNSAEVKQFIKNLKLFGMIKGVSVTEYDGSVNYPTETLFVAIGGDGTMLYTARAAAQCGGSVVGFNFGSIGFLTDHNGNQSFFPVDFDTLRPETEQMLDRYESQLQDATHYGVLDAILRNDQAKVQLDSRSLIQVDDGDHQYIALNEVYLAQQEIGSPFTWEVEINGQLTAKQTGSGVLVATPTGSTAMAMSAGGAIVHPTARTMEIVPVTPVTLVSRPIIASGLHDVVRLKSRPNQRNSGGLSLVIDGQVVKHLECDDQTDIDVYVQNSSLEAVIWHKKDWNFFSVLSQKFSWDQ